MRKMIVRERQCRVCGCTNDNSCDGGCFWVEEDLCHRCVKNDLISQIEEDANKYSILAWLTLDERENVIQMSVLRAIFRKYKEDR